MSNDKLCHSRAVPAHATEAWSTRRTGRGIAPVEANHYLGTPSARGLERVYHFAGLAVRRALDTGTSGSRAETEFGDHVRRLCDSARELGLQAEDVITIIKKCWRPGSEGARLEHRDSRSVLDAVVTACIEEFYRSGHDGSR